MGERERASQGLCSTHNDEQMDRSQLTAIWVAGRQRDGDHEVCGGNYTTRCNVRLDFNMDE